MIATPSYAGLPCPAFLDSLEATEKALRFRGDELEMKVVVGHRIIQAARNDLVAQFRQSDADVLFFIDDDLAWPVEAFLKLLDSDKPITCGAYPYRKKEGHYAIVINTNDDGIALGSQGWISTHLAPGGFLCIKREAIELMVSKTPHLAYEDEGPKHDLFPQGVRDGRFYGEDFAFSKLWRDMGGFIWCWPDISFDHAGTKGNYHEFLMAQPKVSNAA